MQLMRGNWEWQRWEEADKWHWNPQKRRLWAEDLWRSHHQRRLQRGRLKEYLQMQQERERYESHHTACQCLVCTAQTSLLACRLPDRSLWLPMANMQGFELKNTSREGCFALVPSQYSKAL